jgi:hypothetical protein
MGNEIMKTRLELDAGTPKKTRREKDPEKTRHEKNLVLCRFCELDQACQVLFAWRKLCA